MGNINEKQQSYDGIPQTNILVY